MCPDDDRPSFDYPTDLAEQELAEWLLPRRLIDLADRIRPGTDRYTLLGSSLLLRSLLLDPMNVEALARRRHSLPAPVFEFTPYESGGSATGGLYWVEDGVHRLEFGVADATFQTPTTRGDLTEFLRAPVARHRETSVSVKNFIRAFAHVLGGVHLGRPKSEAEKLMQAVAVRIEIDSNGWADTLRHIGAVTHRALLPVVEAIERKGWEIRPTDE